MAAVESKSYAEALLLKADKTYGIHAGASAVRSALDHVEGDPVFRDWVLRHLEADNLLTPDELAIYMELDRAGKVDELSRVQDLTQAQGVSEHEVRLATEELQRSTQAIQKQTEILQLQSQAVDRAVQKKTGNDRRRRDLEIVQKRKWDNEHKQLVGETESLSYGIEQRVEDLSQDTESLLPLMQTAVEDSLQSDDKLLASLQKLGKELDRQDPNETEMVDKMREICLRLIKTTVETIRTRLDRVYLEALTTAAYQHHHEPPTSADIKALGEEVESLYAEILPVAQMSVEQQRLDPAIKRISARDGQSLHKSAMALQYVSDCLQHLLEKSDRLAQQVETAGKHYQHSLQLTAKARGELSSPTEVPVQQPQPTMPASPVRRPLPIRMRGEDARGASRRRSSGIPEIPAFEGLLETLGVQPSVQQTTNESLLKHLTQVLEDRTTKGDDIVKNAQDSYEAVTTSHIDDLTLAVQVLSDSVLAETSYSDVKFVDADFEASIDLLKSEVEQAREDLSRLEMKHVGKKSERKDDLVNRWTT